MSSWPGKYVIGLTGNIATGKSIVRKMLEYLGAFGIDADGLSHRAIAKRSPAYPLVVKAFGEYILGPDGEVDRKRLGNIVFSDPQALSQLEAIVHPAVRQAIDVLIKRAPQPVIVIEAIKLLEGGLAEQCDAIWVVDAPKTLQQTRLMKKRQFTPEQAKLRIEMQGLQQDKLAQATLVIDNSTSFEHTWTQVQQAWERLDIAPRVAPEQPLAEAATTDGVTGVQVRRGRLQDADLIANFFNEITHPQKEIKGTDIIASLGEKAYFLAENNGKTLAVVGWQVENLVTRVDELLLATGIAVDKVINPLMQAVEHASGELQSEASFVFVKPMIQRAASASFAKMGYRPIEPDQISISAWRQAARESQPVGTNILFKQLREDRVLRPI